MKRFNVDGTTQALCGFGNCTFYLVGPGIISGPWSDMDYQSALEFAEEYELARGGDTRFMGHWLVSWH